MKISIMQPYFFPYAGYFRLINQTDLFVIYDCVQFPSRGWIHRNRIEINHGLFRWLTLPLKKQPRGTTIKNLEFHHDADVEWYKRLAAFKNQFSKDDNPALFRFLLQLKASPIDELIASLELTCIQLDIPFNFVRSSSLDVAGDIRGQDRILEICRLLKAKNYLNASGGRQLYDAKEFKRHGTQLEFLIDYQGSYQSMLQRLFTEDHQAIYQELTSTTNQQLIRH